MHCRSVVAYVGEDTNVRDRVSDAVETAWSGSRSVGLQTVAPAELTAVEEDSSSPLADICGIIVTTDALATGVVEDHLTATPESVPIVATVEDPEVETLHRILETGVDDVVAVRRAGPSKPERAGTATDPIAERLREAIAPALTRLGADDIAQLRDVLLDAGTTLMSTRSDEVETKIVWTIENVGRQVAVDRIVCYLEEEGAFEPAYHWSSDECDPDAKPFEAFPDPEELSTFENVARPAIQTADADGGSADTETPPATIHVPLVSDWELIGVLAFESDEPRAWTEEEVAAYRTFGDLIAHTIARNERRVELRRQTERLEQFSAVVSHDLRNPLNVLSGYLDLVENDIASTNYEAMERAVLRMETLIDDLLMLAKRGDAIDETEPVPVASIAEDAWNSVRAPRATLAVEDDVGRIEADPSRLRQLFENLFRNAVDHGGPDATIEVGTDGGPSDVSGLFVADDGPGVPPEARDSLFDSGFSTAESSGLGLAIVDRIADAHGWELDVRNDGGAVFEVSFGTEAVAAPA